jgi:acyl carrier protein
MAAQTVFVSHETYTPARGGSASAEVTALRHNFGDAAKEIIVTNTKGFTGHPMGAGVEDVIAVKILEHGIVPPVPNYKEVDPDLGELNLSRGGRYPVQYAIHLAAGFGSQISLTLTRRIPGSLNRTENPALYQQWLDSLSGYNYAQTEVVKRVLRIKAEGNPPRPPAPSTWGYGTGPLVRVSGAGVQQVSVSAVQPVSRPVVQPAPVVQPVVKPAAEPVQPLPVQQVVVSQPVPEPVSAPVVQVVSEPVSQPTNQPTNQPANDPVESKVLEIVAQQTGYPLDMLDLELDMEADLGIDTVKQAETFAAIRAEFAIPRNDSVKLRDYPTLGRVVQFVREARLDLASQQVSVSASQPVSISASQPVSQPSSQAVSQAVSDPIESKVLAIVAAQTGYPLDMLDLELDMEADLGIDTVKQAETFAAIRAEFAIPRNDNVKLRDYPTLGRVVEFVREARPDLVVISEPVAPVVSVPVSSSGQPTS